MLELFKYLISIAVQYGYVPIVAAIIVFIIYSYFNEKKSPKEKHHESGEDDHHDESSVHSITNQNKLEQHQFFTIAQYKLNMEIPILELCPQKPVKQALFRDVLSIFLSSLICIFKELVDDEEAIREMPPREWGHFVNTKLVEMNEIFRKKSINASIPVVAIDKFSKWNERSLEMLSSYINNLADSLMFPNNIARTNTLLYLLQLLLVTTIADAEKSLYEVNGQLSGKLYNGKPIES